MLGAAEALGIREVHFLDYIDGDLDQAPHDEVVAKIVSHIRRVKPDVVITFAPDGAYGHPDHIAICQFTTAAVVCAADPNYGDGPYQNCIVFPSCITWPGPKENGTLIKLHLAIWSCTWMVWTAAPSPGPIGR